MTVSVTVIVIAAVVMATIAGLWWWRRRGRAKEEEKEGEKQGWSFAAAHLAGTANKTVGVDFFAPQSL